MRNRRCMATSCATIFFAVVVGHRKGCFSCDPKSDEQNKINLYDFLPDSTTIYFKSITDFSCQASHIVT